MKKNAFTLAELLGVIIILGIIVLLVVTPIVNNINQQGSKIDDLTVNLLYATAETYIEENGSNYKLVNGVEYYISIQQLIDSKILESKFTGKDTWKKVDPSAQIKVTVQNENFNYELIENDNTIKRNIGKIANDFVSTRVDFNGTSYYSQEIVNNVVSYGGLLWRIIGINNDGSIRLVLNDNISSLILSDGKKEYKSSFVRTWLNEEFYSRIANNDIIVKNSFCIEKAASNTAKISSCNKNIKDNIGLLSLYEINSGLSIENIKSLQEDNTKGVSTFATSTLSTNSNDSIYISNNSLIESVSPGQPQFIKPVINIIPTALIISGTGTRSNPYLLNKKITFSKGTKTSNADIPLGTYIKYNNSYNIYRVMEVSNDYIKLVNDDVLKTNATNFPTSLFSSSNKEYNVLEGIGYALNNNYGYIVRDSTEKNIHMSNMTFNGTITPYYSDYRLSSLKDATFVANSTFTLLKLGDVFATPCSKSYSLSTEYSASNTYIVNSDKVTSVSKNTPHNIRYAIFLSTDSLLGEGNGTKIKPLEINSIY